MAFPDQEGAIIALQVNLVHYYSRSPKFQPLHSTNGSANVMHLASFGKLQRVFGL